MRQRNVYPNIKIPKNFRGHCSDIVPTGRALNERDALRIVDQYQRCRIASDATFQLVDETNKLFTSANADEVKIDEKFR